MPVVILHAGLDEKTAFKYEVALIAAIGRTKKGGPLVNMTDGGEGTTGKVVTEEVKRKLSIFHTGLSHSAEARERMRASQTGRRHPDEVKQKIGRAHRGKTIPDWHREAVGRGKRGVPLSEEHKAKIAESTRKAKLAWWAAKRAAGVDTFVLCCPRDKSNKFTKKLTPMSNGMG